MAVHRLFWAQNLGNRGDSHETQKLHGLKRLNSSMLRWTNRDWCPSLFANSRHLGTSLMT